MAMGTRDREKQKQQTEKEKQEERILYPQEPIPSNQHLQLCPQSFTSSYPEFKT